VDFLESGEHKLPVKTYLDFMNDYKAGTLSGIYRGVPNDVYHGIEAFSGSQIGDLIKNPQLWKYKKENPEEFEAEHFDVGSAFHTSVLEPEKWNDEVAVCIKVDRRTKIGKEQWAAFQEANLGKTLIKHEQGAVIERMTKSLKSTNTYGLIVQSGVPELSVFHTFKGVLCRIRPDWLDLKRGLMINLKSDVDAEKSAFRRKLYKLKYHASAAFYLDVFRDLTKITLQGYGYMVVEKKPPHSCGFYNIDEYFYGKGVALYEDAMEAYKQAQQGNIPSYPDQFIKLIPEPYMVYDEEDDQ